MHGHRATGAGKRGVGAHVLVSVQDQLGAGSRDDLRECGPVGERVFGFGEPVHRRMVHQDNPCEAFLTQRLQNPAQASQLFRAALPGRVERRGCHRARDPDQGNIVKALDERIIPGLALSLHVGLHVALESLLALAAPRVGVVVAGDDRDRYRDRLEFFDAKLELGLECKVGEVTGHHKAVEAQFRRLLHHTVEQRLIVLLAAVQGQVESPGEALTDVAPWHHPVEAKKMDVRGMQEPQHGSAELVHSRPGPPAPALSCITRSEDRIGNEEAGQRVLRLAGGWLTLRVMSLLEVGRTHTCGELRREHAGASVVLFGWVHRRRDLGARTFIQLRDRDGITQLDFAAELGEEAHKLGESLRSEDCIAIRGKVADRGSNANSEMETGEIEVKVSGVEVFSRSQTPPFVVADDERLDATENLRLQYRYLDLRRPVMQRNFRVRSQIGYYTRKLLTEGGFYELETPAMVKYTPGGARNFLVPSRIHPGQFYALAESPQIYKQLFMVSGFDKYFQITRCFRDEDLRNDRQPEFTQIDVEMSFATPERIFEPMQALMRTLWKEILDVELPETFPRMSWDEAMARYGSDKPDVRFGLELKAVTEHVRDSGFKVFDGAQCVSGLCVPADKAGSLSRGAIDKLTDFVKQRESGGAKGLAWTRIGEDGSWSGAVGKNVKQEAQKAVAEAMGAGPGCVLLFIADEWHTTHTVLCNLRLKLRDQLDMLAGNDNPWQFLWITDFPMFEKNEAGDFVAAHHPFTSPHDEHVDLLVSDPAAVRAKAYDLVLNGNEIGGGSIRIHNSEVQAKVFTALGLTEEETQFKFGFLLEAFKYGPPPHGGIALGLDRVAMLMTGAKSLRDVIAFPKTQRGQDLMTGAPTIADEPQLADLYLTHRDIPVKDNS